MSASILSKFRPGIKTGFVLGTAVGGALIGYGAAQQGLKKQGLREGALEGLTAGAVLAVAPTLGRLAAKGAKPGFAKMTAKAREAGKLIFRRVHGRIIPIMSK